MVFFITVLRALAACLITNSHYTGIYPTDLIANGGLIGDIIFFAVSGYCLYDIKMSFPKWYIKRLYRIYLPVWIITALFLLLGCYDLINKTLIQYFIYPTDYHFVASIVVLYLPYYFVVKLEWLRKRILEIMIAVAIVMLFVYVGIYDKSYYHIDTVREPFIRFLFFESMLLGAYFRRNDTYYRNNYSFKWVILTALSFCVYFGSKMIFTKMSEISDFQILNQYIIFVLLYFILRMFAGMDNKLEKLPQIVCKAILFMANITLEIYLVQYVLIDALRPYFGFPLNWLLITSVIIVSAYILHLVCKLIYNFKRFMKAN